MVGRNQRGAATASLQFSRSVGGSLGVGVMGAILAFRMQPLLTSQNLAGGSVAGALLDPKARSVLTPEALALLQQGLAETLHIVFLLMAGAAIIGFACTLLFPRGKIKAALNPQVTVAPGAPPSEIGAPVKE